MTEAERFAPTVLIPPDRHGNPALTVTPEGWVWVLAFALRGCDWAVEEASDPAFREAVLDSLRRRRMRDIQGIIEGKLDEIERLRAEMRRLGGQSGGGE